MKKYVKAIGLATALAVMIPLSAYAAAGTPDSSGAAATPSASSSDRGMAEGHWGHWKHGRHGKHVVMSREVLDLLKLDRAELKEKVRAGKTLAKIAQEQGVSREALKKAMTDAFNKRLEEHKKRFADNLDKMIDSKPGASAGHPSGFHVLRDLTEVSKVLGLTTDEVKNGLRDGKSLADLAAEKKVDVQKLVDVQKAVITDAINQAVKDGKITQQQANLRLANAQTIAEKIVNAKGFMHRGHDGGH